MGPFRARSKSPATRRLVEFSFATILLAALDASAADLMRPDVSLVGRAPNWTQVIATDEAVFYLDYAAIERDGEVRRWWESVDRTSRASRPGSTLYHRECDCDARKVRLLQTTSFSGSMAKGTILFTNERGSPWRDVEAGTIGDSMLHAVCARWRRQAGVKWTQSHWQMVL